MVPGSPRCSSGRAGLSLPSLEKPRVCNSAPQPRGIPKALELQDQKGLLERHGSVMSSLALTFSVPHLSRESRKTCFFLLPLLSPCQSLSCWVQWEPVFGKAQEQGESCFLDRSSWCQSGLRSWSLPPAPLPADQGGTALLSVYSSCWDWSTATERGPWEWEEAEASA